MAGQPHRSGGGNRLPIDVHVLRGTFRRDRHSPRPEEPATRVSRARQARLLKGLQDHGRRICTDLLDSYGDLSELDLAHVREAGVASDTLADLRAAIDAEGGAAKATQRLLKFEHQAFVRLTKAVGFLRED